MLGDTYMNINRLTGGLEGGGRTRNDPATPDNNNPATPEAAPQGDQVRISASSLSIQQIEAEVRQLPEVDDATIERIRSQLQNGSFQIDYDRLAGKMLDFEERFN